jgi:hypothetical protein
MRVAKVPVDNSGETPDVCISMYSTFVARRMLTYSPSRTSMSLFPKLSID